MNNLRFLLVAMVVAVCGLQSVPASAQTTLPKQNPIVMGNNRLTLITPTLFRLEYAEDAQFLDNQTIFAHDRSALLDDFTIESLGDDRYKITTSKLEIVYHNDGFPFGLHNFQAYYQRDGKRTKFTNRGRQGKNLGGAISTLDRVKEEIPLEEGLLSRDGWYVINDTGKDILVDNWLQQRPRSHVQDQYCFVYGNDYKAALASLGAISGHVPMTRKYVHGVWYCRYWDYTAQDYIDIVEGYKQHDFPMDNLVFDMGWHTYDATVGTGHSSNRSWTGYTWNKKLIPNPDSLIKVLLADNIYVSLNDHPHDGIRPNEEMYGAFMMDMGRKADGSSILFDAGDRKYMQNFFKHAHGKSMDMGVAFWWLDWQQNYLYPEVRGTKTSHLAWLNKLYFEESEKRGGRGAGYSRWAGWGDHRHPIQFSGDAVANWDMLAFEVKLTSTSGNAGCYYWAHDVGGFYGGDDPEMYVRWTQFGALSAALRVHSDIASGIDRRPWLWGDQAEKAMKKAYHFRAEILPYIYSSVYKTHSTMIPLNRAMYIEYGDKSESFENPQQFLFGDLLLAAPIASPGEGADKVASQKVWFPEGDVWYDFFDANMYKGGVTTDVSKNIDEFPLFVKGGYMMPMQNYTQRPASTPLAELVVRCYPSEGDADNTFLLYEDDGVSNKYKNGESLKSELRYKRTGNMVEMTVTPDQGKFDGMVSQRSYRFELPAMSGVSKLTINGRKANIMYDEKRKMHIINVSAQDIHKPLKVSFQMM